MPLILKARMALRAFLGVGAGMKCPVDLPLDALLVGGWERGHSTRPAFRPVAWPCGDGSGMQPTGANQEIGAPRVRSRTGALNLGRESCPCQQ
jgi:hypothetical protein